MATTAAVKLGSAILTEIREMNTSYLRLVQRLVATNRVSALSMLGMTDEIADTIVRLSPEQLTKLATTNVVLCRIRIDGPLLLTLLGAPLTVDQTPAEVAERICAGN